MLYDRWRAVAQEFRNDIALHDLSSGKRWTFGQMASVVECTEMAPGRIAFPQGHSSEFIFSVLKAWRANQIVCPLEAGQPLLAFDRLPEACVHLKVTSATSGPARVIAFRPEQLCADAENIVTTMGLRRDLPNLGVISLAHSYGFSNLVLPLLLHGIPMVLGTSPLPEMVKNALSAVGSVTLPGVPALWRAWWDAGILSSDIRLAISAGSPLPLPLEETVHRETGIKIHNFYGSSECGGIAYDVTNEPRVTSDCVGQPMKNVSLSINEAGCLEVRSWAVAETYWPDTDEALNAGRFRTSDVAEIKDGVIFLRGRAGDQINVAGRKVSPEFIERVLLSSPDVSACVVFGIPSPETERSDTVAACVVGRNGTKPEALRQFLLEQLPAWQVPREWWMVDSIDANQRGKVSRSEWRKKFLANRGG